MCIKNRSILNNVIYLDIGTTGFHKDYCEIIEIAAIKIKDDKEYFFNTLVKPTKRILGNAYDICKDLKEEDLLASRELKHIKTELIEFLEDLPILCDNGEFKKDVLLHNIPQIKNEFLDITELAALLEPYHNEYVTHNILEKITSISKKHVNRALEDVMDNIKLTNALLCRLWAREENTKSNFYNILVQDYNLLNKWMWTKYLEKPLFFDYEEYDYVLYSAKKEKETKNNDVQIDYNKFEELLKNKEIWSRSGDFNYQYRVEQKNFSGKIRYNIENQEKIFIEAPTGSGKTFAYLLIVILESYKNIKRNKREDASFIISTDTKELQNQLINKDLPNILSKLNLQDKIKYGAIKGKSNYICNEKLKSYKSINGDLKKILGEIFLKVLCNDGNYGDIENINYFAYKHFDLEDTIKEVRCNNDDCNLERCRYKCYLKNRYLELPNENITVVNHSLLASWPYGEKKKITHLILDEAHNLMDKCYEFFSEEFNTFDFSNLLAQALDVEPTIYRTLKNLNSSTGFKELIDEDKIKFWIVDINKNINLLLSAAIRLKLINDEYNFVCEYNLANDIVKEKVHKFKPIIENTKESIRGLYSLLNNYLSNIIVDDEFKEDKEFIVISGYLVKLKSSIDVIENFLDDKNNIKFAKVIEINKDYSNYVIKNIPLNVDELFNECILKEVKSTTFLSATMRINNSFNRIKGILGQNNAKDLVVPPTFDIKNRTRIFTINDLGSYYQNEFIKNSANFIFEIAKRNNGHILVLFTNNLRLKLIEEELLLLTKGSIIEVYNNKKAIKNLNDKNRSVIILGSKGFFEGIDVPGDGLTTVILDKLPNKNIEDPLLKAITTYQNKDYQYYNYPQLCIKVKQIYGRLIRSVMDYGYFCILDGGNNKKTLQKLQCDLNGPMFLNISSNNLLNIMNKDYYEWNNYNLNSIISSNNNFDYEAKKRKLFWEITKENSEMIEYTNLNIKIIKRK